MADTCDQAWSRIDASDGAMTAAFQAGHGGSLPVFCVFGQRDRLCVQLRYLAWLLLTVELSIFHRPSSATSR
jgi:hypothetical protein